MTKQTIISVQKIYQFVNQYRRLITLDDFEVLSPNVWDIRVQTPTDQVSLFEFIQSCDCIIMNEDGIDKPGSIYAVHGWGGAATGEIIGYSIEANYPEAI